MSNSDDLKPQRPPTLLGTEPDAGGSGQTRILASLEGRVSAAGKASQKSGRRYGAIAAIAVAGAAAAVWTLLGASPEADAPVQAAKPLAPAKAEGSDGAKTDAPVPAAATPAVAVVAEAAPPATIIDDSASDHELDRLGKIDGTTAAAGALALAALSAPLSSSKDGVANGSAPAGNNKSSKKAAAPQTSAGAKPVTTAAKEKAQSGSKTGTKRKGSSRTDDPDAEVLAALLSQPEGVPLGTTAPIRKTRQSGSAPSSSKAQ